ncbi:hypothetical protein [Campylobacter corcagiensis]|uniref:hypothetical protein n=1 Tax=Campylobacter corcagiensis TaxID=1448857 RepID=UPI0004B09B94|nr:hypothetical protein [Campylobacter corcagiensis]
MTMDEINERLKDIISNKPKFRGKIVKDKDVATTLGLDPNNYAQLKFRNSPPYKDIMDFLAKEDISINLFFYGVEAGDNQSFKTLRMFDINASLGGGANNSDEEFEEVVMSDKILERRMLNILEK